MINPSDEELFNQVHTYVVDFFNNDYKTVLWWTTRNSMLGDVRPIDMILKDRGHKLLEFVRTARGEE